MLKSTSLYAAVYDASETIVLVQSKTTQDKALYVLVLGQMKRYFFSSLYVIYRHCPTDISNGIVKQFDYDFDIGYCSDLFYSYLQWKPVFRFAKNQWMCVIGKKIFQEFLHQSNHTKLPRTTLYSSNGCLCFSLPPTTIVQMVI